MRNGWLAILAGNQRVEVDERNLRSLPHQIEDLRARHVLSLRREQIKLVDDWEETVPRHQALLNHLNTLGGGGRDGGLDEIGWNFRQLDQYLPSAR